MALTFDSKLNMFAKRDSNVQYSSHIVKNMTVFVRSSGWDFIWQWFGAYIKETCAVVSYLKFMLC